MELLHEKVIEVATAHGSVVPQLRVLPRGNAFRRWLYKQLATGFAGSAWRQQKHITYYMMRPAVGTETSVGLEDSNYEIMISD